MVGGAPLRRTVPPASGFVTPRGSCSPASMACPPLYQDPKSARRNSHSASIVAADARDFRYHTALRPQSCELVGAMDEKRACRGVPPVIMFGRGDNTRCRRGGHLLDRRLEADPVKTTAFGTIPLDLVTARVEC